MKILATIILLIISGCLFGQRMVQDFTLNNVADGSPVTLSQYTRPVAIIFLSHDCAFDKYYPMRIRSLIEAYSGKVEFLLINAGIEPGESTELMLQHYHAWGYQVPYLADKGQITLDILGAHKTPEAFLLNKSGGHYVVAYHGPIDDNPQIETDVKEHYLRDNINRLLAGEKIKVTEVRPGGCTIRRK